MPGRPPGSDLAKLNAIVDVGMIDALYRASRGVSISLVVRGMCLCSRGRWLSENVTVKASSALPEHARSSASVPGGLPSELIVHPSAD
jgi:polyphosphate kinase